VFNHSWGYPSYYSNNTNYSYGQPIHWGNPHQMGDITHFNGSHTYGGYMDLKDYGNRPFIANLDQMTKQNNTFRTALWTGEHLQVTLMCIDVGDDIGLEIHPHNDQFLRIVDGQGIVQMGDTKEQLNIQQDVGANSVIIVPAGKWHNLVNTGNCPLKLYSIYAPPEHPHGTVHRTKREAMEAEEHHYY